MPSTVYKGDLSEISFGHESGMKLTHDYSSSFIFTAKASGTWASDETSIIEFSGGAANTPCNSGILEYPIGMLVGAKLCFHGMTQTSGNRFYADDNASNGSIFTIVKHAVVGGKTQLTIHPRLTTNHTNDCPSASTAEIIEILPYTAPSMDVAMTYAANANASAERVLTDQFVGIMNVIALPETKVDLKRYHVVGLGRDVAVQVPGRFTNVGGSFEHNLHNSRWLYYALGNEVVNITGETGGATFLLNGAVEAGASRITYDGGSAAPTISGNIGAGDYVVIEATSDDDIDINSYREETTNGIFPTVGASNIITKARPEEVRRIVAIHDSSGSGTIWLDGPLNFSFFFIRN